MSRRGVDRLALLAVVLWTSLVSSAACDRLTDTSPAHPPVSEGRAAHAALDHPWDPEVTVGPVLNQHLAGRGYPRIFPDDNWWNRDIRDAPVDPRSDDFIRFIGHTTRMHPDFAPPPYGMPYIVVGGDQELQPVEFVRFPEESDAGGYPIPEEVKDHPNWTQQGDPGFDTDRHVLMLDRDNWILYELWQTHWNEEAGRWEAGSGAIFNLMSNVRRPLYWTSADAAGLEILPGLLRWDEVFEPDHEIDHAFRVTMSSTNGFVWPALHQAGNREGALPMGARLRLRPTVDLSSHPPEIQRIFRAMQTYGLIVADNGGPLFVGGTMDPRWDNSVLNPAFHSITAEDFEIIELGWRPDPDPDPEPEVEPLVLTGTGRAHRRGHVVTLRWRPKENAVDVYRDGVEVAAGVTSGRYRDTTRQTGSVTWTYWVCRTGTDDCSDEVVIAF